jgi:hypothetical protein
MIVVTSEFVVTSELGKLLQAVACIDGEFLWRRAVYPLVGDIER